MNDKLFVLAKNISIDENEESNKKRNHQLIYYFINLIRTFFGLNKEVLFIKPTKQKIIDVIEDIAFQAEINFIDFKENRKNFFLLIPLIGIDKTSGDLGLFLPRGFNKLLFYSDLNKWKICDRKFVVDNFFLLGCFYPNLRFFNSINVFFTKIFSLKKIFLSICLFAVVLFSTFLLMSLNLSEKIVFLDSSKFVLVTFFALFLLLFLALIIFQIIPGIIFFILSVTHYFYEISFFKHLKNNKFYDVITGIKGVNNPFINNINLVFLFLFLLLNFVFLFFFFPFLVSLTIFLFTVSLVLVCLLTDWGIQTLDNQLWQKKIVLREKIFSSFKIFNFLSSAKKIESSTNSFKTYLNGYVANVNKKNRLILFLNCVYYSGIFLILFFFFYFYCSANFYLEEWQIIFIITFVVCGCFFSFRQVFGQENFLTLLRKENFHEEKELKLKLIPFTGKIELKEVGFSFKNENTLLFDKVSIIANPKEMIGIIGRSGLGKTVLLKILSGLNTPSTGLVLYDGQDSRSLNLFFLREYFGCVFHDSKLFAGTVLQNIINQRSISDFYVHKWLSKQPIFEPLFNLPMGLNTYIFWHERNITPFERSLILIAKILLVEPKVIFLDEPFLDVDNETQTKFWQFIKSVDATKIICSHAIAQEYFDKIYQVEDMEVKLIK